MSTPSVLSRFLESHPAAPGLIAAVLLALWRPSLVSGQPSPTADVCLPPDFYVEQTIIDGNGDSIEREVNLRWFSLSLGLERFDLVVSNQIFRIIDDFNQQTRAIIEVSVDPGTGEETVEFCIPSSINLVQELDCVLDQPMQFVREVNLAGGTVPSEIFRAPATGLLFVEATAIRLGSRVVPTRVIQLVTGCYTTTDYWNMAFEIEDPSVFDLPAECSALAPPTAGSTDGDSRALADRLRERLPRESVERILRQPTMRRLLAAEVEDPRAPTP